ncbi:MAG TPA: hypothetical protein VGB76_11670 [Pyrinomonadaceae bacterium]|jgi:hypothetical protein
MRKLIFLLLLLCPFSLTHGTAQKNVRRDAANAVDVYAVVAEVERIAAARTLWPNFDPRRVPVEIYDGQTTLLFQHPAPPPEFVSLSSRQGVWAFPGRHETVTANAPVKLNNVLTATVMFKPGGRESLRERAALVVHETFHVFQRERHPKWAGDELELFVYPFDDAELLALRRLETEALRRADEARRKLPDARCWARLALTTRRERFARMRAGAVTYERATELNEGLARYVEARAAGTHTANLPAGEYPSTDLRTRAYATGHAFALLLERFAPVWTTRLEAGENLSLDELLNAALSQESAPASNADNKAASSDASASSRACALPGSFAETARRRAGVEVASLQEQRATKRREFEAQGGWKIVVKADAGAPLWPQGFDPLNVLRLGLREVLHTRYLKLGNDAGAIEILDRHSLTEGAGAEHPLWGGVRQLTLAGITEEPAAHEAAGKTTITAANIKGEFRGAQLERAGQTLSITLQSASK